MTTSQVTVVIPVYNETPERLLPSVESALETGAEVILVDDGSGLDVPLQSGLRILIHQENRGHPAAMNTGIRAATTRWVAPLDCGDVLAPDRFCVLPPAPLELGWCDWRDGDAGEYRQASTGDRCFYDGPCAHSCLVFTRELWARAGGYDERMVPLGADWEFLVRAYHFADRRVFVDHRDALVTASVRGGNTERSGQLARDQAQLICIERARMLRKGQVPPRECYT